MGSLLAQNNEGGKEQAIYYLSRILTEIETRYTPVERLCLALYFTACKLRHYMLLCHIHIIANIDVIKAEIAIIDPKGAHHCYLFLLNYQETTNNLAEYEALIIDLEILIKLGAIEVKVFGDSELVINQLNGEYKFKHITMAGYYLSTTQLLSYWGTKISVSHISRESKAVANEMAQLVYGAQIQERRFEVVVEVQRRNLPSIFDRGFSLDVMIKEPEIEDWRLPITQYLKDHSFLTSKKNRQQATKYALWEGNLLRKL
ncbi:uncharacterized protein [Malus domestica]|uniref:uncharacterized protein n=1 Tax=Malus domestica TaxID=3750 RepID=UPI003974D542